MRTRNLFFICFIMFFSCLDDDKTQLVTKEELVISSIKNNNFELSVNDAKLLLKEIKSASLKKFSLDNIESLEVFYSNRGKKIFYIYNNPDGGFILLSADKRVYPIIAHSDKGFFSNKIEDLPDALHLWLENLKYYFENIIYSNNQITDDVMKSWDIKVINKILSPTEFVEKNNYNGDCEAEFKIVEPLMKTEWGQGLGYNEYSPFMNCENINGKAPSGCVATAMAQVMRYHEYPLSYNWISMPNKEGSYGTSRLMKDIGNAVNMKYSCNGSSAKSKSISPAFVNQFHYKTAILEDYDYLKVIQNLENNKPVILLAVNCSNSMGTNCKGGHAWVTDGYKRLRFTCQFLDYHRGYKMLYMNWGWGPSLHNGWFDYSFWNPGENSYYLHKQRMIYNINY